MNKRVKHVVLILLIQTGCLGVGLWMHHHFLRSATQDEALQQAWSELEQTARKVLPTLNAFPLQADEPRSENSESFRQALEPLLGTAVGALIVDRHWHVLTQSAPASAQEAGVPIGRTLAWTPVAHPNKDDNQTQRGAFAVPEGTNLAVAHSLPHQDALFVLYRSRDDVDGAIAAVFSSLNGISALTWLWTSVLLGIANYMVVARFHDEAKRERTRSVSDQLHQRQTLLRTRDAVIFGLAKLADSRDPETGDHLERISVYSTLLASVLRNHPRYASQITPSFLRLIGISSALHDIGKVGIEDRILLKPGPLTPEERQRIQAHADIGGRCLQDIEQRLGSSNFLQMAREIAFAHHERWDGTGYPGGLKGEDIPLAARIVAIADVYDAVSSRRVYKGPQKHADCVKIIVEAAGKHFDPGIVEVWMTIEGKFRDIARRYAHSPVRRSTAEVPAVPAAQDAEFQADDECVVVAAGESA